MDFQLKETSKGVFLNGTPLKGFKLCFAENLVGVRECLRILAFSFNDVKSLTVEKLSYLYFSQKKNPLANNLGSVENGQMIYETAVLQFYSFFHFND